ncbi:hypothetical protein BY458DRAFT_509956 [Sporodiniella umbellata]|nr:hypothetical protein BY458DRAFT_509956 [Sporodiniella umbellata]
MGQQASREPLGYVYQPSSREEELMLVDPLCENCSSEDCPVCGRNYLQKDLEYIDRTYYPQRESPVIRADIRKSPITPSKRKQRRLRSVLSIDLSERSLIELSPAIQNFKNLTSLVLANNHLTVLPKQIGFLKSLCVLNISNNKITTLPETIGLLTKLKTLYAHQNQLQTLPASIGQLSELSRLDVDENQIMALPKELSELSQLTSLGVSGNPLRFLPAELATLSTLSKIFVEGCDFQGEYISDLRHNPVSLVETCARIIVRHNLNIPSHLKPYFSRVRRCSFCSGPYFDQRVIRYRRTESWAFEYTMCSAHWSDEQDRILALFSESPQTVNSQFFQKQDDCEDIELKYTMNSISTLSKGLD